METIPNKPSGSAFSPLKRPVFAVLWAATVLGTVIVTARPPASKLRNRAIASRFTRGLT